MNKKIVKYIVISIGVIVALIFAVTFWYIVLPIGAIVIYIWYKTRKPSIPTRIVHRCSYCKMEVSPRARSCPHCGETVISQYQEPIEPGYR